MTPRTSRVAAASAALVGLIAPAVGATAAHASPHKPQLAPVTGSAAPKLAALATAKAPEVTYRVASGDTFWSISRKFNVNMQVLAAHNGLKLSAVIHPGQLLKVPSAASTSTTAKAPAASPAAKPTVAKTHVVRAGQTLTHIARDYKTTVASLVQLNGLSDPNRLHVGQSLKITAGGVAAPAAKPNTPAAPAAKPAAPAATAKTHVVRAGQTLSGIALEHGTTVAALVQANGITNPNRVFVGQVLNLSGSKAPAASAPQANITKPSQQLVPDSFLGRTYPAHVVNAANQNKALLNSLDVPSRAQMQQIVRQTAVEMGVDPSLALAVAFQESSFNHRSVSPANAIGTMQVIPSSGDWASQLVGRKLNLIDPHDNAVAGVAILRQLVRSADSVDNAIAGYYQGLASVNRNGMFADTKVYVQRIKSHQQNFR